jgi:D-methionine transport system ATP-binding protein
MAPSALLSVQQLSLQDQFDHLLLASVSFTVAEGDRLGIIGASGTGKTTLLRLLVRLLEPTTGEITLKGRPIQSLSPLILRRRMVLVPQEPKLLGQTVQETLCYPLQLQKLPQSVIAERLDYWRSQLPFPDDWLMRDELHLSLGQRQWVSILRGLMMEPQILLLDEPTSALDPDRARQLITVLTHWTNHHPAAVIMVNHQREWVDLFAQRTLTLERQDKGDRREWEEDENF